MEIPNSTYAVGQDGFSELGSNILDYSGTFYDPVHNRAIAFGGGHAGYPGNDINAFSPADFSWEKDYPPTPCSEYGKSGPAEGVLPDGRPWTAHTYRHVTYITHINKLFYYNTVSGGYMGECPGIPYAFGTNTFLYDYETRTWDLQNATGHIPRRSDGMQGAACAYDPVSKKVYLGYRGTTWEYDVDGKNWTGLSNAGSFGSGYGGDGPGGFNMVTMAPERVIIALPGTYAFNLNTRTWRAMNPSGSAPSGGGMAYDTLHHELVVCNNSRTVYRYSYHNNRWTSFTASGVNPGRISGYDPFNNVFLSIKGSGYNNLKVFALKIDNEGFDTTATPLGREMAVHFGNISISVKPNPFNSVTFLNVECRMPNAERRSAEMKIFSIEGKLIEDLPFKIRHSLFGIHYSAKWNAAVLPSGIYILRANIGNKSYFKKLFFQK
jgi:hypothetical protein